MTARPKAASGQKLAKQAISEMNPALTDAYVSIRDLLTKVEQGSIMARWEVGQTVDKTTDEAKYGESAVDKLATALGIDDETLLRCRAFTITYDRKEVKELLERRTESDRGITWSHIDLLNRVPKDSLRKALTDKFFKQELTVRELSAEIQSKLGRRGKGKGRPRIGPKTPLAAINVINRQTQADADIISGSIPQLDKILDAPSEFSSDSFLADVGEALNNARVTGKAYNELVRKLESVEAAASKSLRAKKNKAEADKTSAKATERAAAKAELSNGSAKKKKKTIVVVGKKKKKKKTILVSK